MEGHPEAAATSWPCHSPGGHHKYPPTEPHWAAPSAHHGLPAAARVGKPHGAWGGPFLCLPRASGPGTSLYMGINCPSGAQVCGRANEVAKQWECGQACASTRPWVQHLLPSQQPDLLPVFCCTVPLSQQLPAGGHVTSPFCSLSLKLTVPRASCLGTPACVPSVTGLAHLASSRLTHGADGWNIVCLVDRPHFIDPSPLMDGRSGCIQPAAPVCHAAANMGVQTPL